MGDSQKVLEGLGQTKDRLEALASSATTSKTARKNLMVSDSVLTALSEMGDADTCTIENKEKYIVGQSQAFENLQKLVKLVIDDVKGENIGVFGKRGSGKSLLLRTVYNKQEVRTHFSEGLILWLTVSQKFCFKSLVNDLCKQIAIQKNDLDLIKDKEEVDQKNWLNQQLQDSSRFVLFLDDVCENNATSLLEELGIKQSVSDHSNSKVVASYRDPNASSEMGIADKYSITMPALNRDDSWLLFKEHAFPYNKGMAPSNIDEENLAKLVCEKCGGLPLAINVVGRAMAGGTDLQQWQWALQSLLKATQDTTESSGPRATQDTAESSGSRSTQETTEISGPSATQDTTEGIGPKATKGTTESIGQPLNACLRLSLDALGNQDFNLQLCFLYIAAAFSEDAIIDAQEVIPLLIGEGLLARKVLKHVPQPTVLADRRLIEPMIINTEGRPVCLRMQDPFELGRLYLDLLAERCLIEPTARDASGRVLCFRMLKVVHDWAIPIAKDEGNFYHCVDNSLEDLQKDGSAKNKRIFLSCDKLSSFPQFSSPSHLICSSLISQNKELKIPKKVFGSMLSLNSMLSLKVLDLSGTSAASLPENVGRLKQLRCLKLSGRPIKRLPKSLTALGYLEILDVSFTDIEELPSNIHLLRSLRYLGLRGCRKLHNLPSNISGLLSLQYLYLDGCDQLKETPSSRCKKVASLHSLFDLIQLKKFALQINSERSIRQGTLGSMTELDTLLLVLPEMKSLPYDIYNLSKLRSLSLKCSKLVELEAFTCSDLTERENRKKNDVTNLKHLRYLKFYECGRLKHIQPLQKLQNLRQLEIILCPEVRNFPIARRGAFPALKIFSLVGLQNLEELPVIEEGAMPSLEVFNIMNCTLRFPNTYLNNSRVRVYGCPEVNVAANMEADRNLVKVVSEGTKDIITSTKEIITKYRQALQKKEDWLYGEFWCNEFFQEYCIPVKIERIAQMQ